MNRIRWYGPTILLLIAVLLVMVAGPGVARKIEHARKSAYITNVREDLENSPSLQALSNSFREVAQVVEPSVVHIQVARRITGAQRDSRRELLRRFFDPRLPFSPDMPDEDEAPDSVPDDGNHEFDQYNVPEAIGNGSGWVYDEEGHIITNRHVIDGADEIIVRFYDRSERKATVIGQDPRTDIAVLKVEGDSLHPARLAPEPVQQGDIVFAFGSPFRFEFSMSQGIVSAKGRQLGILGNGGYEDFIQTDAAINPGNSGGPLTNVLGQVVGMNTAIATRTQTYNGLGFAIPADMLTHVIEQLLTQGKVTRGYLGIFIRDLDPKMARTFDYDGKGVLVENPIPDGPAAEAGVKRGDIVTEVNGRQVQTAEELRRMVADYSPGKKIKLTIFRDGEARTFNVTIAEQPEQLAAVAPGEAIESEPQPADAKSIELLRKLGIEQASALDKTAAGRLKIDADGGVLVERVRTGSVAASVGLRPRSVITEIQGIAVHDIDELVGELSKHDLSRGVRATVIDGDTPHFVLLELPKEQQ